MTRMLTPGGVLYISEPERNVPIAARLLELPWTIKRRVLPPTYDVMRESVEAPLESAQVRSALAARGYFCASEHVITVPFLKKRPRQQLVRLMLSLAVTKCARASTGSIFFLWASRDAEHLRWLLRRGTR
jgi:hypothetical protein